MPDPARPEQRIARARPFAALLGPAPRVEPVGVEFAHSGTAFFVTAADGRRFKLRDAGSRRRAAAIAGWVALLPDVFPALAGREGRYLLLEALDDHRRVTRHELVARAHALGRIGARAHQAGRPRRSADRLVRRAVAWRTLARAARDLRLLRRRGALPPRSCDGAAHKLRARFRTYGLPVGLELDDLHKGNVMLRESDGDLRYVDEEGIGLRPVGMGMASLLKTATYSSTWEDYRAGWAEQGDASLFTAGYTEYLLLLDAVRRVAQKERTGERAEKLPRETDELRAMADRPDAVALDWRFPRG